MKARAVIFRVFPLFGLVLMVLPPWSLAGNEDHDKAYEYNRQGMIMMGMARFREARSFFQEASALIEDYQITEKGLEYTPVFLTAWASEKIGEGDQACEAFERFLEIAPLELADPTKIDHANTFVAENCRMGSRH